MLTKEVNDTAGVAPLFVIPGHELDEVGVQGDTGTCIEDGRVGVAVQVSGDDLVFSVGDDACEVPLSVNRGGGPVVTYPCKVPQQPP